MRNTLRELLFEIPVFRQLAEWEISPTLVAGGQTDEVGVAPVESSRPIGVGTEGEGGAEVGCPATTDTAGNSLPMGDDGMLLSYHYQHCKATASQQYCHGHGSFCGRNGEAEGWVVVGDKGGC